MCKLKRQLKIRKGKYISFTKGMQEHLLLMSEVKVSSSNTHCLCHESGQVDGQLVITMVLGTCIGGNVLA